MGDSRCSSQRGSVAQRVTSGQSALLQQTSNWARASVYFLEEGVQDFLSSGDLK